MNYNRTILTFILSLTWVLSQCQISEFKYSKITPHYIGAGELSSSEIDINANVVAISMPFKQNAKGGQGLVKLFRKNTLTFDESYTICEDSTGRFGNSIGLSQFYLFVGDWFDNELIEASGAVYVYKKDGLNNWCFFQKLKPNNPSEVRYFGYDLDVDHNNNLIVGAIESSSFSTPGAIYFFTLENGKFVQKSKFLSPSPGIGFGESVAIFGNVAAAGAPYDDQKALDAGAVYFYWKNENSTFWNSGIKRIPFNGEINDYYGSAIDLGVFTGNAWSTTVVIGAPGKDQINAPNCGAVYFIGTDGFQTGLLQYRQPAVPSIDDNYFLGSSVSIGLGCASADAPGARFTGPDDGKIFIFGDGNYSLIDEIQELEGEVGPSKFSPGGDELVSTASTDFTSVADRGFYYRKVNNIMIKGDEFEINDLNEQDLFGYSISASGNFLAIGSFGGLSYTSSSSDPSDGSAFVFTRILDTITKQSWRFFSPNTPDIFGRAVDIYYNEVIVGDVGEAYIYETDGKGWRYPVWLHDLNGVNPGLGFGTSVAITENIAVVGSPNDNSNSGAVYIFVKENNIWKFDTKLLNDDSSPDYFGQSVDVDSCFVIIGAPNDDEGGTDAGAVYIRTKYDGGWFSVTKIIPKNAAANGNFGRSVELSIPKAIIGSPTNQTMGNGSAYVYEHVENTMNDWVEDIKFNSPQNAINFGWSVSIDNDIAAIGAPGSYNDIGHTIVYQEVAGNWQMILDRSKIGQYGYSVECDAGVVYTSDIYDSTYVNAGGCVEQIVLGGYCPETLYVQGVIDNTKSYNANNIISNAIVTKRGNVIFNANNVLLDINMLTEEMGCLEVNNTGCN